MSTTRTGLRRLALALAMLLGILPAAIVGGATPAAHAAIAPRVAPSLSVSPLSATAGTTVTLTGANYTPSTSTFTPTVTVAFTDSAGVRTTLPQTATIVNGSAFALQVAVPITASNGPATFGATDDKGVGATAAFDVRPAANSTKVVATPSSGLPGSTTTITGTGFAAVSPITLTYTQGSFSTGLVTGSITTTNTGMFTSTITIPGSAPAGTAAIAATDRDNNNASTSFTVIRNGTPTVAISPTSVITGSTVTVTGTNFAASEPVTLTFGQGSTVTPLISGTISTDVSGTFTTTTTIPTTAISGTGTMTATDAAGNTGAGSVTITPPYNVNNGPTSLYFAEGYTGLLSSNGKATFDETLSILNANPFTATVQIRYLIEGGNPVILTRTIPASSTLRESVNNDVGPDKNVAAVVTSDSRVTAERIIRRTGANNTVLDADSSLGNPNLGKTFYFAEGYTGSSFQEYLTLANPGPTPANVTVTFAPQGTTAPVTSTLAFVVPANGRVTRNIRRDTLAISNKSLGMIVTSDQPIMAERVLYFGDGSGSAKYGATAKAGIQTVGNQYVFAYGSAGGTGLAQQKGDQSFVTILNPGTSPVSSTVVAQFYNATGQRIGQTAIAVAPGTRETINANQAVSNTASIYATILTSASPFVAEKPQYYGGSPNVGTHPGVAPSGAPAGVKSAAFPDLSLATVAGQQEQQTVFLYNPGTAPISVTGTYYSTNGTKSQVYTVPAGNIVTVNVNADTAGLPSGALGATYVVTSAGATDSFVATNIAYTTDGRSYTGDQGALPAQ